MPRYVFPESVGPRPPVDVVDSSWLAASPRQAAAAIGDARRWPGWWPGLTLRLQESRGDSGVRWFADAPADPPLLTIALSGTAEVWLQPDLDGVIAHFFLRLEPAAGHPLGVRNAGRVADHYRRVTKRALWALGDELDPGRLVRHRTVAHVTRG